MKLALDTNKYSALQRGEDPWLRQLLEKVDEIFLPFVVVAELRAGFKKSNQARQNLVTLDSFLSSPRVFVLYADENTLEAYANVWAELMAKGTPIPTNDVWIAAICQQHALTFATSDRHFDHVPLLNLLDS